MATTSRVAGGLPKTHLRNGKQDKKWHLKALPGNSCCRGIGWTDGGIAFVSPDFGQSITQKGSILRYSNGFKKETDAGRAKQQLGRCVFAKTTRAAQLSGGPYNQFSDKDKFLGRRATSFSAGASGSELRTDEAFIGGPPENVSVGRPRDGVLSKEGPLLEEAAERDGRPQNELVRRDGRPQVNLNLKGGHPQKKVTVTPVKQLAVAKDAASLPELDELEQIFTSERNDEIQRTPLALGGNLEALGEPRLSLELLEELLSGNSGEFEETESEGKHERQGNDQKLSAPGLIGGTKSPSSSESVTKTDAGSQDLENGVSSSERWSHSALETALRTASNSFSDASRTQSNRTGAFESLIDPGAASLFVEDGRTERLPIEDVLGQGAVARKAFWKAEPVGQKERRTEKSRSFELVERERRRENSWQAERVGRKEAKAVPGLWSEWLETVKTRESPSATSGNELDSLRTVFEGPIDAEDAVTPSNRLSKSSDTSASGWSTDKDGGLLRQERRTGDASASQRRKASRGRGLVYEELSPSELFGDEPFEVIARKVGKGSGEGNDLRKEAQGAVEALGAPAKHGQNGDLSRSVFEDAKASIDSSGRSNSAEEEEGPIRQERFADLGGVSASRVDKADSSRKHALGNDSPEWGPRRDASGCRDAVAGSFQEVRLSRVGESENSRKERSAINSNSKGELQPAVRGVMDRARSLSRGAESKEWKAPESEVQRRGHAREVERALDYEQGTRRRETVFRLPEERYRPYFNSGSEGEAASSAQMKGKNDADKERAWAAWQNFSGERSPEAMEHFFSKWMEDNAAGMSQPASETTRVSQDRNAERSNYQGDSTAPIKAPRFAEKRSSLEARNDQRRDTSSQPMQLQRAGGNGPEIELERGSVKRPERNGFSERAGSRYNSERDGVNGLERGGVNEVERGGVKRPERARSVNGPERDGMNGPDRYGVKRPGRNVVDEVERAWGVTGPERDDVNGPQGRERDGVNGPRNRGADVSMMSRSALLSGWGIEQGADPDWLGDGDQPEADTWQQEEEDEEEEFVQPNETDITKAFDRRSKQQEETGPEEEDDEEAPKSLSPLELEALTEEQQKAHLLAQTLDLSLQNRQNALRASRPKKKPREETSMDERGFARFGEVLPELERQKLLCQKVKSGKLVWAPCCVYYIIHHSHTEILRFFNARTRALARQWKLGYVATRALNYYMRSSCALTLAMKHELKSRAAAYRKWGRELTDPITRAKFDMRTPIPKGGWDSIDWDRPVGVRAVGGGYYTPEEMRVRSRMVPQPITWQVPTKEDPTMGGRWDLGIETPAAVKDRPRPQPRKQGRR